MLEVRLALDPSRTQSLTTALLTTHGVFSLVFAPIIAHFADKTPNRKIPLLISLVGCFVGTALVALTPSRMLYPRRYNHNHNHPLSTDWSWLELQFSMGALFGSNHPGSCRIWSMDCWLCYISWYYGWRQYGPGDGYRHVVCDGRHHFRAHGRRWVIATIRILASLVGQGGRTCLGRTRSSGHDWSPPNPTVHFLERLVGRDDRLSSRIFITALLCLANGVSSFMCFKSKSRSKSVDVEKWDVV